VSAQTHDRLDAVSYLADKVAAGVVEIELGRRQGQGADLVLQTMDADAGVVKGDEEQ
jgi:hypothetical protein